MQQPKKKTTFRVFFSTNIWWVIQHIESREQGHIFTPWVVSFICLSIDTVYKTPSVLRSNSRSQRMPRAKIWTWNLQQQYCIFSSSVVTAKTITFYTKGSLHTVHVMLLIFARIFLQRSLSSGPHSSSFFHLFTPLPLPFQFLGHPQMHLGRNTSSHLRFSV